MSPYLTFAERLVRPLAEQAVREQEKIRLISLVAEKRTMAIEMRKKLHLRIEKQLRQAYPNHFSSGAKRGGKASLLQSYWRILVIPELDNFIHGLSDYSIIVALYVNRRPEHVVLYFPYSQISIVASAGAGAYMERRRLRLRKEFEFGDWVLTTNNFELESWRYQLAKSCNRVVHTGSVFGDLMLLLNGRIDILLEMDVAHFLAELIEFFVRESGGLMTSSEGSSSTQIHIIASSLAIMDELQVTYPLHGN